MSSKVTDYFKTKKRRRTSDDDVAPTKRHATDHQQSGNSSPVKFTQMGQLSPKRKTPPDLKQLLKGKEKLADLKKALMGIERCSSSLSSLRRATEKSVVDKPIEKVEKAVVAEKFYSPKKDVFSSPTKKVTEVVQPAYKRYHHLTTKTPPLSKSPQKPHPPVEPEPMPLPYKHKLLLELFTSLDTVASILQKRKESITFPKLQSGVLELVRVIALRESHLGQMMSVMPGCFAVQREKRELVVEVEVLDLQSMGRRKKMFREGLVAVVMREHGHFLSTLDITIPPGKKITRWHPKFKLDSIPPIPPHPLPLPPDDRVSSASELLSKAKDIINSNGRVRRALESVVVVADKPAPVDKKHLKALQGVSQKLIEKIRAREKEKTVHQLTKTPTDQRRDTLLRKLPPTMIIIRNVFVNERKAALSLDLVAERVSHSLEGVTSVGDSVEQIRLLAEVVPDWIQVHSLSQGEYLKVDLRVELGSMVERVKCCTN